MKQIKGFEDYLITEEGKIFSNKNNKLKEIKITTSHHNYQRVRLFKDGKVYNFQLHRLVAMTYIPNPENKEEIDHIDNNPLNNNVNNLRWVTRAENCERRKLPTNTKECVLYKNGEIVLKDKSIRALCRKAQEVFGINGDSLRVSKKIGEYSIK